MERKNKQQLKRNNGGFIANKSVNKLKVKKNCIIEVTVKYISTQIFE